MLEAFCLASGLKINYGKSVMLGINLEEEEVSFFASLVGCSVGSWPIIYLGLPLGGNPNRRSFWEPVVNKVARRLDGWKRSCLSRGGRLTLIQSVLSAVPIYYLSIFKIPSSVARDLEKLMRDFLWGEGDSSLDHLVAWGDVSLPKENGGLGIGNLVQRNISLLCKWWWRFSSETNSLWHSVIVSRYGIGAGGWFSGHGSRITCRSPWKGILDCKSAFLEFAELKVGNGQRIRFWEDVWEGNLSLCSRFPALFQVSSLPTGSVSDFAVLSDVSDLSWNLHLRRGLRDGELVEL